MGNIISNTTQQTTALDLSNGNLNVKNQFSASGPSTFNGTGTFNKPVILNDTSTFNATGVFNKPVTFNDSVMIPNNKINNIDLTSLSSTSDVSTLRTTVSNLVGPTGTIDTSLVKTSKLDINGDIVNTGTGAAYITANTGTGLTLKDGLTTGGSNIKIYNGTVTVNGALTTGAITGGAITGTSLSAGTGAISGGSIRGTSLNIVNGLNVPFKVDNSGAITGTSLSAGSTGAISGGAFTGSSLSVGSGAISGGSLNVGAGAIKGGEIKGTSLNILNGINNTFKIENSGAITGTSLSVGSGAITGGAITGTSLSAGIGAISGGSLDAGAGVIKTTGSMSAGSGLKIGSINNWTINEDLNGRLCFYKGAGTATPAGFACIDTTGNLVPF
jgi:hypothetical protein